ncbi:MAG: DUF962 domain-containing protein [Cytophagaceae bacterium]|nr:DUF962 domain-containing protein [Cytophagaceae bacterium]
MRTIQTWLDEYGESHKNPTNKLVHWICVPTICFTVIGLLYSIKLPIELWAGYSLNVAHIVLTLVLLYYIRMSVTLSIGLLLFLLLCMTICSAIERSGVSLPITCVVLFVAAWLGQFWGHKIEGKKPSFLKDIQFLMIGPAWLMSFIYRKLGIPY